MLDMYWKDTSTIQERVWERDSWTEESIDVTRTLTETQVEWTDHAITLMDYTQSGDGGTIETIDRLQGGRNS